MLWKKQLLSPIVAMRRTLWSVYQLHFKYSNVSSPGATSPIFLVSLTGNICSVPSLIFSSSAFSSGSSIGFDRGGREVKGSNEVIGSDRGGNEVKGSTDKGGNEVKGSTDRGSNEVIGSDRGGNE